MCGFWHPVLDVLPRILPLSEGHVQGSAESPEEDCVSDWLIPTT